MQLDQQNLYYFLKMGNNQSKKEYIAQPSTDIKINHQRFEHFYFHKDTEQIEINMDLHNQRDYKEWSAKLNSINNFEDKENLLLPAKSQFNSKGFCGNAGTLKIFYQNYPYLFEQQIQNRIQMDKHFQQQQLWYLLYSLVSSAADFNRIGSKIGDVRPKNIFINEDGQIKIANLFSWPYQKHNFDKFYFQKTVTYLSPQQMKQIAKGIFQTTTNKTLTQSFSIGLTLLQAGLLFNASTLYSVKQSTIDIETLNNRLNDWIHLEFSNQHGNHIRYSPLLRNIITAMCCVDDKNRLNSLQVAQLLQPYHNQILNLKEFDTRNINLPNKYLPKSAPQPQYYVQRRQEPLVQSRPVLHQPPPPPLPVAGPAIVIPQQTVVLNQPFEPKTNTTSTVYYTQYQRISQPQPPPQPHPHASVRFNTGQTVIIPQRQYQQRIIHNQPLPPSQIQSHQQIFYKYANMSPNMNTIGQPTSPPKHIIYDNNRNNYGQVQKRVVYENRNEVVNNGQYRTVNTRNNWETTVPVVTEISRPYSQPPSNIAVVSSPPLAVAGSNDGSSDFLRRIDQQLEASRRQFPS